jgi:hypothetical protein
MRNAHGIRETIVDRSKKNRKNIGRGNLEKKGRRLKESLSQELDTAVFEGPVE